MDKFEKANEYKKLCEAADGIVRNKYGAKAPDGWNVVDKKWDRKTNFKAVTYEKNNEQAVCFVGTDFKNLKDHGANLKMGVTGNNAQIKYAKEYTQERLSAHPNTKTTLIGHSEGGTEATCAAVKYGIPAVTFNAYGIYKNQLDKSVSPQYYNNLVTNYRDPHDPISKLHENIGKTYIVESNQSRFKKSTPFGYADAHRIQNFGDCNSAIPLEQYKKSNPEFINNISETDISNKDVASFDTNLFDIYSDEIYSRLSKNKISVI